jgi:hypothetical protein
LPSEILVISSIGEFKMPHQYNLETKNILDEWITTLKQKDGFDETIIAQLEALVYSGEIGDQEKIRAVIEAME